MSVKWEWFAHWPWQFGCYWGCYGHPCRDKHCTCRERRKIVTTAGRLDNWGVADAAMWMRA